ncbi:hypothetical protein [Candidatus Nitrosocosmicus arcticus]|uniref:Uncharacterized protein n=1 Tax=Candidatus Nitrosocosmicus arcticus TaxID=2035267 RepID=A0A557SRS7_9ARCH|nr:hypothetical protein [Candidatus Nitrosocosmicus arcticus]TVP39310.1 hypothetical protein NARC_160023 [Candidatus Nitrosocosmicus arcticus]
MTRSTLLIYVGILSIVVFFNTGSLYVVAAQLSVENSSNLTSRNNPSVTIGEMLNGTNMQGNNSNESDSNLGLI